MDEQCPPPSLLSPPNLLSDHEIEQEIRQISRIEESARYSWARNARPSQIEPPDYRVWAIMAGRGFGKTRTGAETVRKWATDNPGGQYAVLAKSHREVVNICFEAPRAGLMSVLPVQEIKAFHRAFGMVRLNLANGSSVFGFSAETPDSLRGYSFDGVWADEYAAWNPASAQACFDMLWFCMRESARPRMVITTTPRNVAHVRTIVERSAQDTSVVLTRGQTMENAANLSDVALSELVHRYGDTRLGRQELDGELLLDSDSALFSFEWIDRNRRWVAPDMSRVVVAVDPASTAGSTSDETGLVVVGAGIDGHDYVLADASATMAGASAAAAVWRTFVAWEADEVVIEGSNMWMLDVLQDAWESDPELTERGMAPVVTVNPTRSKAVRAEPVAARYEQGRIHHVGEFAALEEQMCAWEPTKSRHGSPDRMDALVHGVTRLRQRQGMSATISYPPRAHRVTPTATQRRSSPSGRIVDPGILARSAFAPPRRAGLQAVPRSSAAEASSARDVQPQQDRQ